MSALVSALVDRGIYIYTYYLVINKVALPKHSTPPELHLVPLLHWPAIEASVGHTSDLYYPILRRSGKPEATNIPLYRNTYSYCYNLTASMVVHFSPNNRKPPPPSLFLLIVLLRHFLLVIPIPLFGIPLPRLQHENTHQYKRKNGIACRKHLQAVLSSQDNLPVEPALGSLELFGVPEAGADGA